jgi:hypothetical protein
VATPYSTTAIPLAVGINGNDNTVEMATYSYTPITLGSADPSAPHAPVVVGYSVVNANSVMPFESSDQQVPRNYYNQPNYPSSSHQYNFYPSPSYSSSTYPQTSPSAVLSSSPLPVQDVSYLKYLSIIASGLSVLEILLVIVMLAALDHTTFLFMFIPNIILSVVTLVAHFMFRYAVLSPSFSGISTGCCATTAVIPWILIICSVLCIMFAALYYGLKPEIVGCKKDPFTPWASTSYTGKSAYYQQTMSCSGGLYWECYCYDLKMKGCVTYPAPDSTSNSAQTCSTFLAENQLPVDICALVVLGISVFVLILTSLMKCRISRIVK